MTDLKTRYLGLTLKNPLMPGASPLVDDLDQVRQLEDANASAIVMHSLFEEQILATQAAAQHMDAHTESYGEALSYLPDPAGFKLGPDKYLERVRLIKKAVSVPVIASLNGISVGGWTKYATLIQEAGADALELNIYMVATDPKRTASMIEAEVLELVKEVKHAVRIPLAVKLSPFFTSLPNFAAKLDQLGVDGIILFNRFYQPDINVVDLKVQRTLKLSDSSELLMRLHGLAILSGHVRASLAASGGAHTGLDAIKAIMSGANGVQMVSALLLHGPARLGKVLEEMTAWMDEHEYASVEQMTGSMSLSRSPEPGAFERLNYMELLQSWRPFDLVS